MRDIVSHREIQCREYVTFSKYVLGLERCHVCSMDRKSWSRQMYYKQQIYRKWSQLTTLKNEILGRKGRKGWLGCWKKKGEEQNTDLAKMSVQYETVHTFKSLYNSSPEVA